MTWYIPHLGVQNKEGDIWKNIRHQGEMAYYTALLVS